MAYIITYYAVAQKLGAAMLKCHHAERICQLFPKVRQTYTEHE